jgi:hypothetical protein
VSIAVQNLHAGTHSTARIEYRGWPPPCRSACRSPPVQRLRRQPQRQTAALAQTRIILGPVRYLEFHLANAMTAGGVMSLWHG